MKKTFLFVLFFFTAVSLFGQSADSVGIGGIHSIAPVVVTGTRTQTDVRQLPMTVSVVGRSTIEQSNQASLLPLLVEQVPGLFITGRGVMGYGVSSGSSGAMTLRGVGNGTQGTPTTSLLVLVDGHPQYMGLMGHPIADACQSMLAERVEVVRGPASVLYGSNAMGGVINIVTRKMNNNGVQTNLHAAYGSFNSVQSELSNRVRAGRFTSVVTGSYNRTDGHRANMAFDQYGGYAKLGYELSERWNVWADVNITHFDAENPGSVAAPIIDNDSHITRGVSSLMVQNEYGVTSGTLSLFYNWGRHKINDGYSVGAEPLDYRFNSRDFMTGMSFYQSATLFEGNRMTVGVDYQHFGGRAWNRYISSGEESPIADKSMNEVAGYVDFRQTVGRWLTLNAGLRLDHHSHVGTEWVPQGGLSFHVSRSAELKAMVSKGFRFPTIREMYMFPPQNPDLKAERLMNYEISYSQRLLEGRLTIGANLFYINGQNIIQRVFVDSRPKYVNSGLIRNFGAEGEARYMIGRNWALSASYSWLHMKYPVVAAPGHKLFGGIYFNRSRWQVAATVQYVNSLYTSVNPVVKENFTLLNLNVNYRLFGSVKLFVRGENLLAQRYSINAGYPMPRATVIGGVDITF